MKAVNIFIILYLCILIHNTAYSSTNANKIEPITNTPTLPAPPALPAPAAPPASPAPAAAHASAPAAPEKPIGDDIATNWAAAIKAFDGSAGITAKTAPKTMPSSMTSTSVGYADAQVILDFLNGTALHPTDSKNLTAQLAANATPPKPATPPAPTPPSPKPATPSPAPSTTTPASSSVPVPETKSIQILASVYIQNNFTEDAILQNMELLIANQTAPLVKSNLNITISATKNIYSKGSMTAFDLAAEANSVQTLNGIQSITINGDKITFEDVKIGSSLSKPIAITKKDGHWIQDK